MDENRISGGSNTANKLGLGCVALGQDYGLACPTDRPSDRAARELLETAAALGVRVLDTAPAYGDSEQRIGDLSPVAAGFEVVSKVNWKTSGSADLSLKATLEALRVPRLHGLLAHSAAELLDPVHGASRFAQLERLRDEGRVSRIGASVYTPEEAHALLGRFSNLDLMQLPMSVLDTRFAASGTLAALCDRGVEVHARSVLLQGALGLEPDALPAPLVVLRGALDRFRSCARELGRPPIEAAVGYVCAHTEVAVVLVGATTASQLHACVDAGAQSCGIDPAAFAGCASDAATLDPRRWSAP